MAKLEELVTPNELLEIIRGGALKNQLIKKYRTSEQELAMMLLPLYRSGDLTKEEFNDFFKGIALTPKEAPPEEAPRVRDDEPPSQILRSLSGVPLQPAAEEMETPERAVTVEPSASPQAAPAVSELAQEAELEPEEEAFPVEAEFIGEAELEEASLAAVLADAEAAVDAGRPIEAQVLGGTAIEHALEVIISKLTSIDNRLAAIEKKPKAP